MSDLSPGTNAPDFSLPALDGAQFALNQQGRSVPVVAAFFKVSCPTCQYTFPFLDRIFRAYPNDKLRLVGISQDDKSSTLDFNKGLGITFPVLLDDKKTYTASNAYGLAHVPSIFLISPAGKIEFTSTGWVREEIEKLNKLIAAAVGVAPAQIFKPGEQVKDFKAG